MSVHMIYYKDGAKMMREDDAPRPDERGISWFEKRRRTEASGGCHTQRK